MNKPVSLLITCEHGGNRIPPRYRHLFLGHEELLQTHRGYDAGGLTMAKELAGALKATLFVATISRLLIDLNRSVGHPRLYSEATRDAPVGVRREILEAHYLPYRNQVEAHTATSARHGFWRQLGGQEPGRRNGADRNDDPAESGVPTRRPMKRPD